VKHLVDYANMLLMVIAAITAVYIPFDLLLISYAILGPLHYMTEISWLSNKHLFMQGRPGYFVVVALCILAVLSVRSPFFPLMMALCLSAPVVFKIKDQH
jgi:hypothetical protein